jgi:hypothetical protein
MTYVKSTNLFPYRHLVNLCIYIKAVTKRRLYIPLENLGKTFYPHMGMHKYNLPKR